ncbi:MAG: hypothetical protein IJZ94_01100 [Clostridia bacterium]|nr:hypothetical protein [Clostridia bacterium]
MKKVSKEKNINISEKVQMNKNKRLVGLIVLIVTIVLVIVLFFATGFYKTFFEFLGFEVDREYTAEGIAVSFNPQGEYMISSADNTIIICDENGITGYDNSGTWKWHNDVKYVSPVLVSYNDFVLIHDSESKCVSAFNSSGIMWSKTFDHCVRNAVAHDGTTFVSVITDSEEYNSEIYIIDYSENSKDVFSGKFVDEYIVSSSISSDCSQFVLSGFYSEGEQAKGVMMFFKMSDGEVFSTEVFDSIYPYVEYVDNDLLVAANSDSLITVAKTASIDTKDDKITTLWSRAVDSDVVISIDTLLKEGFCVSFGSSDENSEKSKVVFYDKKGVLSETVEYSERIKNIKAGKDNFIISSNNSVYLLSKSFKQQSEYTSLSDVEIAEFINSERVLVQMKSRLMIVSFKVKK